MKITLRWKRIVFIAVLGAALVGGCSTDFRDALTTGAFDFVSGSVTEWLQALIPVATPPA